jgi:DNA polymerase III delta prime subunit
VQKTANMATTATGVVNAINVVSKVADCAIDVYTKLRDSFKLSDEAREKSKKCQSEIEKLTFKKFNEKYSCKSLRDIPADEFEVFVKSRLQKRLNLPESTTESVLDGLFAGENEEKINEFEFADGAGAIHHGRLITIKRRDKVDLAYAIYTLSFELAEKENERCGYDWWLGVVPMWNVTKTREIQNLSKKQGDDFSQWCEVKLCDSVTKECQK